MDKALKTMIDNMPEKTGKSLQQWLQVLSQQSFEKHSQAVNFLKKEHGVGHGFANTIVTLSKEDTSSEQDLIAAQYQGKESLKPIYDALMTAITQLGDDVKVSPKKASVSLIRKHQFVLIKPATKTRIDLGLKLKETPIQGKLENSGPFGAMCSHRIQLTQPEDIDAEVIKWITTAYQQSV